ncbi:CUB and sushi domain-containing protein 1-like [Glandiceps talaboti]
MTVTTYPRTSTTENSSTLAKLTTDQQTTISATPRSTTVRSKSPTTLVPVRTPTERATVVITTESRITSGQPSTSLKPTIESMASTSEAITTTPSIVPSSTISNKTPQNITHKIDIKTVFIPGQKWIGVYMYAEEEVPFYMDVISNHDNAVISARINDGKVRITMSGQYLNQSSTLTFRPDEVNAPDPRFDPVTWSMHGTVSVNQPGYLYSGHMTGREFGNFHVRPDEDSKIVSDSDNPTNYPNQPRDSVSRIVYIVIGVLVPVTLITCLLIGVYFYRAKRRGSFHLHTSLLSFSNPLYDGESHCGLSTGPL